MSANIRHPSQKAGTAHSEMTHHPHDVCPRPHSLSPSPVCEPHTGKERNRRGSQAPTTTNPTNPTKTDLDVNASSKVQKFKSSSFWRHEESSRRRRRKRRKSKARKPTKTNSHLHQTDVDVNASSKVHKFTSSHFGVFGGGITQKYARRAHATNCPICRFYVPFSLCVNNFLDCGLKKGLCAVF